MKAYWLKGGSGWCVTKLKGKYVAAFGDEEQVAIFAPYTTRYQAKKIARKWAAKN